MAKVGRNDACPCGSERKFKHCCGAATPSIAMHLPEELQRLLTPASLKRDRCAEQAVADFVAVQKLPRTCALSAGGFSIVNVAVPIF